MRLFVVAAALVAAAGIVGGLVLAPGVMGGGPAPWWVTGWPVLGVAGALFILAAGLVRMARRGS